ncbi:MAG: alpha/beta fold hydrolase [Planctomycetota bacterium]
MAHERFVLDRPDDAGRRIRGYVELPEGAGAPVPAVLVVHGFKGFCRWGFFPELARRLAGAGLAAVCFNLSGSGVGEDLETFDDDEGFEANTYSRELEDVAAVRDALDAGRWASIDPQRIAIFGHSRGGGMALLHAAERPGLRGVALWAAIDSVKRWDEASCALWRERGYAEVPNARTGQIHRLGLDLLEDAERNAQRLDIHAAAGRVDAPALLVHGEADEAVSVEALERIAAGFAPGRARAVRVPRAGHTFGATHPLSEVPPVLDQVLRETVGFLAAQLLPENRPNGNGPS